ncbi:MAG TPA: inositol monophosphatase family protein [bacterium]
MPTRTHPQRRLLAWIEREVRGCRRTALRYARSGSLRVARKADGSPVTAADRAVEERLRRAIARACPGERILGEEYGESGRPGAAYWTIDPIDGTRAFSRGLPTWAIMVGRVERGRPVLGVCDFPELNTTMAAARGLGARERLGSGAPSRFPRRRRAPALRDAVIFHGGWRWWERTPYARGFTALVRACFLERAFGDCYGYLWLLRGRADAVVDYGVKPWDLVPLAALADEAGLAVTDCAGRRSFSGPETVMAPPDFARTICRMFRRSHGTARR